MKLFTKYRKVISILRDALLGRYYEGNAKNFMCQLHEIVRFTYVQTQSYTVSHIQDTFEKSQIMKYNDHTKDILTKLLITLLQIISI